MRYFPLISTFKQFNKFIEMIAILVFAALFAKAQTPIEGEVYDGNGGPLTTSRSPYIVTGFLTVPSGQRLTIQPGVQIRIQEGVTIQIEGTLIAEGTSSSNITYTTNLPGQYWGSLLFAPGSVGSLRFCNFEYGGGGGAPMIYAMDVLNLTIDRCNINHSGGNGFLGDVGFMSEGALSISNSSINWNLGFGIELYAGDSAIVVISNNTLSGNSDAAFRTSPNIYPASSTLNGNGFNGIKLTGGDCKISGTYENDLQIDQNSTLYITEGTTLTFSSGVTIYMSENSSLQVNGILNATGTETNRIRFISNSQGRCWNGIRFNSGSTGNFRFCDLEFGGTGNSAQIYLNNPTNLSIEYSTIRNSCGSGILGTIGSSRRSILIISNCLISNNAEFGISLSKGDSATITISNNTVSNNTVSAFRLSPGIYPIGGNVNGNGFDGIELTGGIIKDTGTYVYNLKVDSDTSIIIQETASVSISPGVTVWLKEASALNIDGFLRAEGTETNRIRFTTATNGKYWKNIKFRYKGRGILKFSDIEYGGSGNYPQIEFAGATNLTIENCNIQNGAGDGVGGFLNAYSNDTIIIRRNTIKQNAKNGIVIEIGALNVASYDTVVVESNDILENGSAAYRLGPNIYPMGDSVIGNGFDGVELLVGRITKSGTYMHNIKVKPFRNENFVEITDVANVSISPGKTIFMDEGTGWIIRGILRAEGSSTNRIRFTTSEQGKSWGSLLFNNGSRGVLRYCDIENGGGQSSYPYMLTFNGAEEMVIENCNIANSGGGGLSVNLLGTKNYIAGNSFKSNNGNGLSISSWSNKNTVEIIKNEFKNNIGDGIFLNGNSGEVFIVSNTIENNQGYGARLNVSSSLATLIQCNTISSNGKDGVWVDGDISLFINNKIYDNLGCGFTNAGSSIINVQKNWWGNSSGPGGIGTGTGDELCITAGGGFIFTPWASSPNFTSCDDTVSNVPYVIKITPDTLLNGNKIALTIYGLNLDSVYNVSLTRDLRGEPNPGNIEGKIIYNSTYHIQVEFDLTSSEILGWWDLFVTNPNGTAAKDSVFVIPSLVWCGLQLNGVTGFPVGSERANYLDIYPVGNDDGFVLIEISPPKPGTISLRVMNSEYNEIWNSNNETDNSKCYIIAYLNNQKQSMQLRWLVPPDKVIYPPSALISPKLDNFGSRMKKLFEDDEELILFGSDQTVSYKGIQGATKAQLKGIITNTLITMTCGGIADLLVGDQNRSNLEKAIDKVIESYPSGIQETPKWVFNQVASELSSLIPGYGLQEKINSCMDQIVSAFINNFTSKAKEAADRYRAEAGGDIDEAIYLAMDKAYENTKKGGFGGLAGIIAFNQVSRELEKEPCNPAPSYQGSSQGKVRGPWDPNIKISIGSYLPGSVPDEDSTRTIYLIPAQAAEESIRYRIVFENIPHQASDTARNVYLVDTLDANLDLSTLQIDSVFSLPPRGTFEWSLSENVLRVTYRDINLPPNVAPPEGIWQFEYTIKPKKNLPLGTQIKNRASIVFDYNPPILTQEIIHVIGSPEIASSKTLINFGNVALDSLAKDTVTIKNVGGYRLAIGTLYGLESPFTLLADSCSGKKLNPGDSCSIIVQFNPDKIGQYLDTLFVPSSDIFRFPLSIVCSGTVSLSKVDDGLPNSLTINIFNSLNSNRLTVRFAIPKAEHTTIKIFDILGREIATLVDGELPAGEHSVVYNAEGLPSGVYFLRLQAGKFVQQSKMVLMR